MKNILIIGIFLFSFVQCIAQKKELKNVNIQGKESNIYSLRTFSVDKNNNKYVFGEYKNQFSIGTNQVQGNYEYSYYLTLFDANNTNKWLITIAESNKNNTSLISNLISTSIISDSTSCYIGLIFSDSIKINGSVFLSKGDNDVLIIRINLLGQILFANQIYSKASDFIARNSMIIDKDGRLTVIGTFGSWLDSVSTLHLGNDSIKGYNQNGFLIKLDTNGNYTFSKSYGGIYNLALGNVSYYNNELYVTASSLNPITRIDSLTINCIGIGLNYLNYIIKIDSTGIATWAKYFGMNTNLGGLGAADIKVINDNIYIGCNAMNADGNLIAKVYFQNGGFVTGLAGFDYFIASYKTSGNYKWAKASQSYGSELITQLSADSNNNLLAVGYFDYTMAMGTDTLNTYGGDDAFVTSLDSNGNYLWSTSAGGAGVEVGNGIATTTDGDIYVVGGTSSNTCYFGQDAVQVDSLPSMFLAKIVNATPVDLQNPPKEDLWEVFPNPVSTMLEIRCPMVGKKEIQLYNAVGQLVINVKTEHQTSNIETAKLPEGIYFLQLKQQGQTSKKKINIIH